MRGCFIDLLGALIAGSKSNQSKVGIALAEKIYPKGEAHENIGIDWPSEKFRRIAGPFLSDGGTEKIIELVTGDENISIRTLVDRVNDLIK